jgi:outer membrane protein assembly factor BamA
MTSLLCLVLSLWQGTDGRPPQAVAPSPAPAPASQVGAVTATGVRRYSEADVVRLSALKAGQPITPSDLKAAVEQMAATGLFASVRYRYVTSGPRLDVVFEIEEPAWTMPVMLDNFIWFGEEALVAAVRQHVPTFDGTLPTNAEVTTFMTGVLQRILDERRVRGRVEFALHNNTITGRTQYLFSVKDTGLSVCALRVTGAAAIPESKLVAAASELMRRDYSRLYLIELANGTLRTMYRQAGYWSAAFRDPLATVGAAEGACAGVTATLRVDEGVPYGWDRADWTGSSVLTSKELDALIGMKPGELADVTKIEAGLRRVRDAYRQRGFMRQRSNMDPKPDASTRRLTLGVTIDEGPQFRMGELTITGMTDQDAKTLREKWRLKTGDVYDDAFAQQFRRENGTPARRLTLEVALDAAKRTVDVKLVAAAR